ncbi:thermonuclease family protein [Allorhizobium borbori]|jgi:endonuclease YncB( thermonuclease family)|uniref:Endonuclease YncB(Thermonuclease family) n=1 Tax=Allorhizobium borbori TaxID=485907 RepID=A0A7W6K4G2_9HYPH|nr:thermonuclease family protein [Allorhizobium borbori]MBB4104116.1 endonuclease YncB(thermonuclease family) [Allorhizobium borbori]PZU21468.1 MAG: nuclease [Shinella sp.]
MRSLSTAALTTLFSLGALGGAAASGRTTIEGPVNATVIRVIDGDTLLVRATPWPQHSIDVYVRLRGIDAPELKARCEAERFAARTARRALGEKVPEASEVHLSRISGDKYFGRVLADVHLADGSNPAGDLLAEGYVQPYGGGKRARPVCF